MLRFIVLLFTFAPFFISSQDTTKKQLDHADFDLWKTISNEHISNDGTWVIYSLGVERGNSTQYTKNVNTGEEVQFERGEDGIITDDSQYVIFKIKTDVDTIRTMKHQKVTEDNLPLDSVGIYNLATRTLTKIPDVSDFDVPKKWSGWMVYSGPIAAPQVVDTTNAEAIVMSRDKEQIIIRNLNNNFELNIPGGTSYVFAEDAQKILIASESEDSTFSPGVYIFEGQTSTLRPIFESKGTFKSLVFDKDGRQAAFLADVDSTISTIRPFKLYHYKDGFQLAQKLVDNDHDILPDSWMVSEHGKIHFSENSQRLFFGISPQPILKDTTLLDEDIVKVEVWSWNDARLHTEQESELEDDKKYSYACVWNIEPNTFRQLGTTDVPEVVFDPDQNSAHSLGMVLDPYLKSTSWEGWPEYKDLYLINIETGSKKKIAEKIKGAPRISPGGKFVYWFDRIDTTWQVYNIAEEQIHILTDNRSVKFFNELHDMPILPNSYGIAGWTEDDQHILINDRYDIWKYDPNGLIAPKRITNGRGSQTRFRYIQIDREEKYIHMDKDLFLSVFNEVDKSSGYGSTRIDNEVVSIKVNESYRYSTRPQKARDTERYLFTKENFRTFPNLIVSDATLKNGKKVSNANPQQNEYSWGSAEIYEWMSLDGKEIQGLLIKPDNFDPTKKYPMIVNFYERSSDGLHRHRAPYPHRSTINYAFYVSRGYVIFNPDVHYKVGYPGESAENCVISGTTALIHEGFVNKDRIGVQGHSWGGYQIAHLITRSNIFKCAESGAPVVNMFSAYGGIRWGTGLSRMFQYENTQSRIGGTIWDEHMRYLENSPLFFADKIETPVLIMHNDKDSAVPWYQGIEFFVAMRRLGKPAWLLNYNNETHWPLKRQNRLDFNIRMQQFFDHYLMDGPLPVWMEEGVPAIEVGVNQGLETKE